MKKEEKEENNINNNNSNTSSNKKKSKKKGPYSPWNKVEDCTLIEDLEKEKYFYKGDASTHKRLKRRWEWLEEKGKVKKGQTGELRNITKDFTVEEEEKYYTLGRSKKKPQQTA